MKLYPALRKIFIFLLFILSFQTLSASNYYWIGNGGNWSDLSHWATTSGGSVLHTQLPSAADDVFFDINSFSLPGQTVNFNQSNISIHHLNWTGTLNNPVWFGSIVGNLTIGGSLTLVTGMTMNYQGLMFFNSATPGQTIRTAGKIFPNYIVFNGTGSWALLDPFISNGGITLNRGSFVTNGHTLNCKGFFSSGDLPRALNLGSSLITVSDNNAWNIQGTNISVFAGTSVINCTGDAAVFTGGSANAVNTYYDLNFTGDVGTITGFANFHDVDFAGKGIISGTSVFNDVTFHDDGLLENTNTFHDLRFSTGHEYRLSQIIITGSLIANGNCASLISIIPADLVGGVTANVSINISYVQMRGIAAGGGGTFTATNSIDLLGNSGWAFNNPTDKNLYWIGNGGNWNDGNHWSLTSGGAPSGCIPIVKDNVIFDANSFTLPGQSVIVNIPVGYCRDIIWTGVTNNPLFIIPWENELQPYGSLTLSPAMIVQPRGFIKFQSTFAGNNVTTAGKILGKVMFNGIGGEWTLQDNLTSDSIIYQTAGTLHTNNKTVNATHFSMLGYYTPKTLNMGSSVFNLSGKYDAWRMDNSGVTINCGTSVINLTNDTASFTNNTFISTTAFTFNDVNFTGNTGSIAGPDHFRKVVFKGKGTIGTHTCSFADLRFEDDGVLQGSHTITDLEFTAGHDYQLRSGTTQTINGRWKFLGTCTNNISIHSSVPGTVATVTKSADSVRANYIRIKDIRATGGARFVAYNSADLGGNQGWIFSVSPPPGTPPPVTGPSTVCPGATGVIYKIPSIPGAFSYMWTVPAGATITHGQGDTLILVNFGSAASGNVSVQADNGCVTSAASALAVSIAVAPDPAITLTSGSTNICNGVAVTFTAVSSGTGTAGIIYDFLVNGNSVQSGTSGTFTTSGLNDGDVVSVILIVEATACFPSSTITSGSIIMQVLPQFTPAVTLEAVQGTTVCPLARVKFMAAATGTGSVAVNYDFKVNDVTVQSGPSPEYTAPVLNGDNISVMISVAGGPCYTTSTATSNVVRMNVSSGANNILVNAGTDVSIFAGEATRLNGSGDAGSYLWSPSTALNNNSILNPVASPVVTTTYNLTITDSLGCSASDSVTVEVKDPAVCISVMNAFTPNGDGINERWIVSKGNCNLLPVVNVYNRYGKLVFHSPRYNNDWQGMFQGKPLPDGTYYAVIQYRLTNGKTVERKSEVTILR